MKEYLAEAKEDSSQLAVFDADFRLLRIASTWKRFPLSEWKHPETKCPSNPSDRWLWIWAGVEVDYTDLAIACVVPDTVLEALLPALIVSRAIYPDGSISEWTEKLIKSHVFRMVKGN
jgi:hypothetical protein